MGEDFNANVKPGWIILNKALAKLLSGQWILTMIAGYVFLALSVQGKLDAKDIVMMVFVLYFSRERDKNK